MKSFMDSILIVTNQYWVTQLKIVLLEIKPYIKIKNSMDVEKYFKSITKEIEGLKDRVRNFIDDANWLTDGEWKESVLRSFLNRNLPSSYKIVRGFIVTPEGPTTQIDLLLYKSSGPVMFRDGDLVFSSPQEVVAIIEVKPSLKKSTLDENLKNYKIFFTKSRSIKRPKFFLGFFLLKKPILKLTTC